MFYLKREREERAAGRSEEAALEAAAATSGRSVLISGLTVLVAMSGMFLTGDAELRLLRRRHDDGGRGRDARLADRSAGLAFEARRQRRPRPRAVRPPAPPRRRRRPDLGSDHRSRPAAPVLSVVAGRRAARGPRGAGATSCTLRSRASTRIRRSSWSRTTASRWRSPAPRYAASVVIKAPNVETPAVQEAIGQLEWRALDSGVMNEPIDVDVNPAKTVAVIIDPGRRATAPTRPRTGAGGAPRRDHPVDSRHARRARRSPSPATRRSRRTSTTR